MPANWRADCPHEREVRIAVSVTVKQPVDAQDDVIFNEPGRRSRVTRGDGGDSLPRVHAERDTAMGRLCR